MQMIRGMELRGSVCDCTDRAEAASEAFSRDCGFDSESVYFISVAVREAVSNAYRHGNKGDPSKLVRLYIGLDGCRMEIGVEDEGTEPFDFDKHLGLKDELLRPNGRGIFFMGRFMDETSMEYIHNNGNLVGKRVNMVKYIPDSVR